MLAVILKILTVIGILLLALLGLVLFVMLIVLFAPITYRIKGQIQEDSKEASIRVRWILGLVRFSLDYTGEITYHLKVLWFDLTDKLSGKGKDVPNPAQNPAAEVTTDQANTAKEDSDNEDSDTEDANTEDYTTKTTSTGEPSTKEPSKNLLFKIRTIYDKIEDVYGKVSYYVDLIRQDDTKHLLSHCLKVLINIIKSIRPKKLVLNLTFGFEEPDTTGKIYGLLCMLYPYYGNDIHIEPDFEKKILQGNVYLKGRILIFILLINALRILLDRKLYKVIHKLKNGGKGNGR